MWALQAKAKRYERIDERIDAAIFPHQDRINQQGTAESIRYLRSGPARPIPWEDTLTPAQRADLEKTDREVEETLAILRASGVAIPDDPTIESVAMSHVLAKMGGNKIGQSVGGIHE
jgi:hypothetical protein